MTLSTTVQTSITDYHEVKTITDAIYTRIKSRPLDHKKSILQGIINDYGRDTPYENLVIEEYLPEEEIDSLLEDAAKWFVSGQICKALDNMLEDPTFKYGLWERLFRG